MKVSTEGCEIKLINSHLSLGQNTTLSEYLDSTFSSATTSSGQDGFSLDLQAYTHTPLRDNNHPYSWKSKCITRLLDHYPDSLASTINQLNSVIRIDFSLMNSTNRWMIKKRSTNRSFPGIDSCFNNDSPIFRIDDPDDYIDPFHFSGVNWICFKDSLASSNSIFQLWIMSRHKNSKDFFYNDAIWSLNDVSQAYVHVSMEGIMRYEENGEKRYKITFIDNTGSLFIDFGSPILTSSMDPEPDSKTMTGLVFNNTEKIATPSQGLDKREGLTFHTKFLQNENIQSVKMFWLTTAISALLTVLLTKIVKLIRFTLRTCKQKR